MIAALATIVRSLTRRPLFALSSILLLTLGSGLAGTLATLVRDVMLRPVPYRDGERLHFLLQRFPGRSSAAGTFSTFDFQALRAARLPALAGVGVLDYRPANLEQGDTLERISRTAVSASAIELTAIPPALGRAIQPADEEPGAPLVALLNHKTWQARFNADPAIVGKNIRLDGVLHTVVGVMPPRFALWGAEIWTAGTFAGEPLATGPREHTIVALLARGYTTAQAQEQITRHFESLADRIPASSVEYHGRKAELLAILPFVLRDLRSTLTILAVAIALLLALTTVNFGSLLFLRLAALRQDFAVRVALGAKTHHLLVQVLFETAPLLLLAAVLAMGVVVVGVPLFLAFTPSTFIPAEAVVRVDAPILAGTFLGTLGLGALAVGVPCWVTFRRDPQAGLRQTGRVQRGSRRSAWSEALIVIVEIGLAFIVILCTAEVGVTLGRQTQDTGFAPGRVVTTRIVLPVAAEDRAALHAAIGQAESALAALPGATATSLARSRPLVDVSWRDAGVPGEDSSTPGSGFGLHYRAVGPGYLAATGMRLHTGRFFDAADSDDTAPVAVINQTLAKQLAPEGEIIGRPLLLHSPRDRGATRTVTVVGVVADTLQPRQRQIAGTLGEIFVPLLQDDFPVTDLAAIVRSRPEAPVSLADVRQVLQNAVGTNATFYEPRDFASLLDERLGPQRLAAYILTVLGGVALLVASLGLYALLAFALAQRTREMGIRQALGATPGGLVWLFVRRSAILAIGGLAAGLLAYQLMLSPITRQLLGSVGIDTTAATVSVATLLATTLVAGLVPGLRAARVDPIRALRAE
jgi:putative ABC transport system permease protein